MFVKVKKQERLSKVLALPADEVNTNSHHDNAARLA